MQKSTVDAVYCTNLSCTMLFGAGSHIGYLLAHIGTLDFVGTKFYCLHALTDSSLLILIRKMLEFSSEMLPAPSRYLHGSDGDDDVK